MRACFRLLFFRGGRVDLQADIFWLWLDRLCDMCTPFVFVLHFAQILRLLFDANWNIFPLFADDARNI